MWVTGDGPDNLDSSHIATAIAHQFAQKLQDSLDDAWPTLASLHSKPGKVDPVTNSAYANSTAKCKLINEFMTKNAGFVSIKQSVELSQLGFNRQWASRTSDEFVAHYLSKACLQIRALVDAKRSVHIAADASWKAKHDLQLGVMLVGNLLVASPAQFLKPARVSSVPLLDKMKLARSMGDLSSQLVIDVASKKAKIDALPDGEFLCFVVL